MEKELTIEKQGLLLSGAQVKKQSIGLVWKAVFILDAIALFALLTSFWDGGDLLFRILVS